MLRLPAAALALGGALVVAACASPARPSSPPSPEAGRVEDATALPAFETTPTEQAAPERYYVEVGDAPARGPDDAPVTIVMFSDFECPYCSQGHETLQELQHRYGPRIRTVYKAFPLDMHQNALVAAIAARSAQAQGKFWPFHDLLFSQQGLEPHVLLGHARTAGLDVERLIRDIEGLAYAPEVRKELRQGRRLGVSSTPTFFVNGRKIQGAKEYADFERVVEDELVRAEEWRAQGIPAAELYDHAIKDGYRKVVYAGGSAGLDPDGVYPVPIGTSPTQGPPDAPVTVVAFEDFECPFCARGNETLRELVAAYPGKIRVVFKHHPLSFHSHAFIAARASLAAGQQGKFWPFHDALYARGAEFDQDTLFEIAKEIGLDMKAFGAAMNSTALDEQIEADLGLAAALGVEGTPAYFVNGRPLEGARPLLHFRLLVEEELARAERARARGVAPADLYETLTHEPLD